MKKSKYWRSLGLTSALLITMCFSVFDWAHAQSSTTGGRDCSIPFCPPAGSPWTVTGFVTDVEWVDNVQVTHELRKGGWDGQDPCNCAYIPCNLRRTCDSPERTFGVADQICWSVGGSATAEGKAGLLGAIFVELSVSVTINAQFTHCHTWSESYSYRVPVSDCFANFARPTWTDSLATGRLLQAESITTMKNGSEQRHHYCGLAVAADAHVTRTTGRYLQYAPYPERCGGATLTPDPYDGMRSIPCCFPLPPCDVVEPGQQPCCACWAPA